MTTTCSVRLYLFSLFLCIPFLSLAQSLEDKVSQARSQQALSAQDYAQIDSLKKEKVSLGASNSSNPQNKRRSGEKRANLDEMVSGPLEADGRMPGELDTALMKDSVLQTQRKNTREKKIPHRYEQRIFQSLDRSAFSGAGGAAGREYVLGPGDEITVSLWGDKEKEYSLSLNKEGKVFLEGIGLVALAGNNLDQAQKILTQRLAKVYSGITKGSAHVEVSLGQSGPIRVFLLGEVKVPGGYVFTGHTSVLSAMYFAKGPTDIGTVRNLKLNRRGNKFDLDLYRYLLRGETLNPDALQDGDILFATRAEVLVEIEGDVGRAAIYEIKKGEGIKELLEFAGGLNPTVATQKMTLQRIFENGRSDFQDLPPPQDFISGKAKIELKNGDRILVEKSTEASQNFMTISGPVKYPGSYEATNINTVSQLVTKAGGLRQDAYLGRVHVVRFRPDGSSILMAHSLEHASIDSIQLQPKDNVLLYSKRDMYIPDSLQIEGAVFQPGKYEFRDGISVKDLIMQAGGFLPNHEAGKILVFRGTPLDRKVEQVTLNVEDGLAMSEISYLLKPNDFVQIPIDSRWYQKEVVTLSGLFRYPGKYTLLYPNERLCSIIERAGGLKPNGYGEGGRFFRSKDNVGRVGVDLSKAMRHPNSKANITLAGGDSIYIPERLITVKVQGEVGFETSVLFQEGATVDYYIEKAGGFTRRSEKNRVVIQYANGESSRDGYFNRKPDAGSLIFVPQGPPPEATNWVTGLNIIIGTMTAGVTLIILTNQLNK